MVKENTLMHCPDYGINIKIIQSPMFEIYSNKSRFQIVLMKFSDEQIN